MRSFADLLWGKNGKFLYLFLAASLMLFTLLGGREIWTQEHRWADIVTGMFFRHDFLHPYLNEANYYDKPLLSYWLIAAVIYLTGEFSSWALRFPSAVAGILAVWSIYRLGTLLKDKSLGLLAGWMLATTFYFIFWARTSSTDMLNMAGSLFAVYWYFNKKDKPTLLNYSVFFLILALTALCKGVVGAIVALIAIFPDVIRGGQWKKHLRLVLLPAVIPALCIYVLPFWASANFGGEGYHQNGLYLVYRENVLRYFQPFDHKDPLYAYFIFLPLYLLPWSAFLIPTLLSLRSRWQSMSANAKWMCWATLCLFVFFTLSGSRRNYYILPVVPFAILMIADWLQQSASLASWRNKYAGKVAVVFFVGLFVLIDILQPLYYSGGGMGGFVSEMQLKMASASWRYTMLDADSKARFYLHLPPQVKNYGESEIITPDNLLKSWPILAKQQSNMVYITRQKYVPALKVLLKNYDIVVARASVGENLLGIKNTGAPVAFIPKT